MPPTLAKHEMIVVGIDPALANMGLVKAVVHIKEQRVLRILDMKLIQTEKSHAKGIIQNHDRLRRGREILHEINASCYGATFACAEIPEGSKSSDAAWSLGIAVGILCGVSIPMVDVRPREAKQATGGLSTANKEAIRQWAYAKYPDAPWLVSKVGKKRFVNDNEHLADAIAILEAGLLSEKAKGLLGSLASTELVTMPFEKDGTFKRRRLQEGRRRLQV